MAKTFDSDLLAKKRKHLFSQSKNSQQDFNSIVGKKYDDLSKAQKAQLEANHEKETGNYNNQLSKSIQEYRVLANQASATAAMQDRARRESMANLGMSSAGGMSRTHQQIANNNLNNLLGSIKLQKQQYNDEVANALANLQSKYNADALNVDANIGAQRLAEELAYNQWDAEYKLQQDQYNQSADQWDAEYKLQQDQFNKAADQWDAEYKLQQDQFNQSADQWDAGYKLQQDQFNQSRNQWSQEFEGNKQNTELLRLIDLYKSKKMTKGQFEALSGIKLK